MPCKVTRAFLAVTVCAIGMVGIYFLLLSIISVDYNTEFLQNLRIIKSTDSYVSNWEPPPQSAVCNFPDVDPFDPTIVKLAGLDKVYPRCEDEYFPEITYLDGDFIRVNSSMVRNISEFSHCRYRNITRPPYNDNRFVFSEWSKRFTTFVNITDEHEFLVVECFGQKKDKEEVVSKAFYSRVPKRAHLVELYDTLINKRRIEFRPKETLNVIAVMIDGLPRHQMIRAMPKTYRFLIEELKSFDFTMFGQTGSHTFPNLMALLSPYTDIDANAWWSSSKPEDIFELIWHEYERAGYRTLFSEDLPLDGGFYWGKRLFMYPQTSYWNRPLHLAMDSEPGYLHRSKTCAGSRYISEFQLDYLVRFLDTFPKNPVAGMSLISQFTHDDITNAGVIDAHTLSFYKTLAAKGHLKKSVIMFFSDHGARWGDIRKTVNGVVESKNPFVVLTFPPWFLNKYPDIARNLKTNTHRLTSHADTRQMLLDLLYFQGREPPFIHRGRHGVSLFKEIPANRKCADASIPSDQCLCGQRIEKFINPTSLEAKLFADALLETVKNKSNPVKCEKYSLGKILQFGVLSIPTASADSVLRNLVRSVRISVEPGGAMFEGTVTMSRETGTFSVGTTIERLNMYKGEVECMPTSIEQIYCYCKGNNQTTQYH